MLWSRRGKYIFTGNSKGKILVVDATTLEQKTCFRVTQTAAANNAVKVEYRTKILYFYARQKGGKRVLRVSIF